MYAKCHLGFPRFIPHRNDSDIQSAFQLKTTEPLTPSKRKMSAADTDVQQGEIQRED
jgi:hypothetical protein